MPTYLRGVRNIQVKLRLARWSMRRFLELYLLVLFQSYFHWYCPEVVSFTPVHWAPLRCACNRIVSVTNILQINSCINPSAVPGWNAILQFLHIRAQHKMDMWNVEKCLMSSYKDKAKSGRQLSNSSMTITSFFEGDAFTAASVGSSPLSGAGGAGAVSLINDTFQWGKIALCWTAAQVYNCSFAGP